MLSADPRQKVKQIPPNNILLITQPLTVKKLNKHMQNQADNLPCLPSGAHTAVRAQVTNWFYGLVLLN